MFIIGLTGGIGSGKSVVGEYFRKQGIEVVDADQASRAVVEKGSPALVAIAEHFGNDILLADGTLDRARLRGIIFDNADEKAWLEKLLHPLIGQWLHDQLNSAGSLYAILESPLLVETQQRQMVDRILVIDAPEAAQLERASIRDHSNPEQIKAIMATQLSREERLAKADDIIDNSGSLENTYQQVVELHQSYLNLANKKSLQTKL